MSLATLLLSFAAAISSPVESMTQQEPVGDWQLFLDVGTQANQLELPFRVTIQRRDVGDKSELQAEIVNGSERIPVGPILWKQPQLTIEIPHYASRLVLEYEPALETLRGQWWKRRGRDQEAKLACHGSRRSADEGADPTRYLGRWVVRFADSEDPAVAVFVRDSSANQVQGTFLTTTGDYRYLAGKVVDGKLRLSCFDGAHAFLFEAQEHDGHLTGSFHSGNWYQTTWTATPDAQASLPDAFAQTEWTDKVQLDELSFPDLQGRLVSLADPDLAGKCQIIEVFGSWCPNCHDAGEYLTELNQKYKGKGLSIVGLAFELTGDFAIDSAQVQKFKDRNGTEYPVLIAGTADKAEATRQLQVLDRVRSYPTFIFLDRNQKVKAIYSGFSGPATGPAHRKMRSQFESLIEGMLQ